MGVLPQVLRLLAGAPWWAYALVVFACIAGYICRIVMIYKISSKALDKASADGVPQIVDAVTGYRAQAPGKRRPLTPGRR